MPYKATHPPKTYGTSIPMTHTTNNDKSHKMKIATAILTTIAILCACNSHKPQSTNAEPSAPSNPSPASSTSTATASPGSTPTDNLRIQHRSTQGRPKAQHPGCSYATCAHHAISLSINTLPPPPNFTAKTPLRHKTHFLRFF